MNWIRVSMLAMLLVTLQGCSLFQMTPTIGLTAEEVTRKVCGLWLPTSYDSGVDSPQSIEEDRVNNAKREEFCRGT